MPPNPLKTGRHAGWRRGPANFTAHRGDVCAGADPVGPVKVALDIYESGPGKICKEPTTAY
jgi:hypothetical protein